MKYKLIGNNDYMINPIETVLKNRGIEDIESFLNVDITHTHNYALLENIDKAVEILIKHLNNGSNIMLNTDSDVDGYTSSAVMYNYIKRVNNNAKLSYHIHTKKIHGIFSSDVPEGIDLVIVPDAGSNNYEELKNLYNRGIDVIILDHHECDKYSPYAVVVNNQMCDYPNKELSGVGIVYKFCQALDDKLNVNYADEFLDLVAMGNIADMMNTTSLETRYYIIEGLKNVKNPFVQALIEKQNYSIKGIVNIMNVAFYITPLINGTIRFGSQEEKINMFKAMLEDCQEETLPYKKRGAKEEIDQQIAEAMARICSNVKGRQDRARDKGVKLLEEKIAEKELEKNKVLIVDGTNILEDSLNGLVAMQLAQKYQKPTLILKANKGNNGKIKLNGSGRNFNNSPIIDFRNFLQELQLFNYVQGHDSAFGFEIDIDNLLEANKKINMLLGDVDFTKDYVVDFKIPANNLTTNFVKSVTEYNDIWGRGVEEPFITVTDLIVNASEIQLLGKQKNTIKFSCGDIEFIKFRASEEEYEELVKNPTVEIELVGRCSKNEWNGNISYQVIVEDLNFKKSKTFNF